MLRSPVVKLAIGTTFNAIMFKSLSPQMEPPGSCPSQTPQHPASILLLLLQLLQLQETRSHIRHRLVDAPERQAEHLIPLLGPDVRLCHVRILAALSRQPPFKSWNLGQCVYKRSVRHVPSVDEEALISRFRRGQRLDVGGREVADVDVRREARGRDGGIAAVDEPVDDFAAVVEPLDTRDGLDGGAEDQAWQQDRGGEGRLGRLDKLPDGELALLLGATVRDVGVLRLAGVLRGNGEPRLVGERSGAELLRGTSCQGIYRPSYSNRLEGGRILVGGLEESEISTATVSSGTTFPPGSRAYPSTDGFRKWVS